MNYEEMMRDMDNYPDTMTEGERSAKYFAGEKVDHQPFSIQSNEEAFANVFGYTTQQINENVEDMAASTSNEEGAVRHWRNKGRTETQNCGTGSRF